MKARLTKLAAYDIGVAIGNALMYLREEQDAGFVTQHLMQVRNTVASYGLPTTSLDYATTHLQEGDWVDAADSVKDAIYEIREALR